MIFTDFAPNESWNDAWVAIKMLLQPWQWKKGKNVVLAKKKLKMYFPSEDIFFFLTGRSALFQFFRSLALPKQTEILVQAFTCEAVVLPILANKLKPVYVDIESKSYSMAYEDLKRKFTKNAKVLILQHTFGLIPADREKILEFAKEHHLFVVEDLAHGFKHQSISKQISSNAVYLLSFGRSKALSSVFGGCLITTNSILAQKLKLIEKNLIYPTNSFIATCLLYKPLSMIIKSTYPFLGKIIHRLVKIAKLLPPEITGKEKRGEFDHLLNKKLPNALAYLLLHQLKKIDQIWKKRKVTTEFYEMYFQQKTNAPSLIRFPILVNDPLRLIKKARRKKIFLGRWYEQPVAPKELDLDRVGYRLGSCPHAEEVCRQIVNLPTTIAKEEAVKLVKTLNDIGFN